MSLSLLSIFLFGLYPQDKVSKGGASMKEIRYYYEKEAEELEDHQRLMYFGTAWSRYWHETRLQETLKIARSLDFGSLLDVGCAEGYYMRLLAGGSKVSYAVGLDIAINYIIKARRNLPGRSLVLGDAHNLPFKDSSFDLVLCSEVLEHTLNPKAALEELIRVSRNHILITVPGENLPHYLARRLGLLRLEEPFKEPGKGHLHELKIFRTIIPWALKSGCRKIKVILTCYFPPTFPEKHRIPASLINIAKYLDKILNRVPVLREYCMVQIALVQKWKKPKP
jgi:ubiquinone/menaquinone biosynthesis C-methylase UbiE